MIKIGFSDNNKTIFSVKNRLEKNGFSVQVYESVEKALEDLISKKIDCLIGGHDISTEDYLKKIFSMIKPQNRVYSYSVLKNKDETYFFADTAVNVSLSDKQKLELRELLKKELKDFDLKIANISFKTEKDLLQVDAALFPEIAMKKGVENPIINNCFIFPDLNSANISYKFMQRLGGFDHIGPILLGTGYNISDLSRGASEKEVYDTAIYLANMVKKLKRLTLKNESNSNKYMEIKYVEKKPTLEEYKKMRDCVDWNLSKMGISEAMAQKSLDAAPYCVCAYDGDEIIGMVRMSGDQGMYGYIQDNIVMPGYQGKGVGKKLMQIILKNVQNKKGYLLGTCPSKVAVDFYASFGFKKRPENPNGFMFMEIGKDELKI